MFLIVFSMDAIRYFFHPSNRVYGDTLAWVWTRNGQTDTSAGKLGSRTVSGLVRRGYPPDDEADGGEKVQLHGNGDDRPSPELEEFKVGHCETGGHAGPGLWPAWTGLFSFTGSVGVSEPNLHPSRRVDATQNELLLN